MFSGEIFTVEVVSRMSGLGTSIGALHMSWQAASTASTLLAAERMLRAPRSYRARLLRRLRVFSNLRGWRRVADIVAPKDEHATFTVVNDGLRFRGDLRSYIDRQVYLYGGYERSLIKLFLERIPVGRRRTIVDVGANVGTHSLAFSREFDEVIAFEPNPRVLAQLMEHVRINGVRNVSVHRVGLADRKATLPFFVTDDPNHGMGTFSLTEQYNSPLREVDRLDVVPGDLVLGEVEHVDAVKLDIQGFEAGALRGMRAILAKHRPFIWIEIGDATIKELPNRSVLTTLVPFSFELLQFRLRRGLLLNQMRLVPWSAQHLEPADYVLAPV